MKTEPTIIDAHALLGEENHLRLDGDQLLRRMDARGVATAVARPMGRWLAVDNSEGNDALLAVSPRVRTWATANPWFGSRAVDELERARGLGAVGLFLHPSIQGFMPTDRVAAPLLDAAARAGLPVMFHTGSYVNSDVLAVAEVARRYPQTAFVAGFGGFSDMWFEIGGALASIPNLYVDTAMLWGDLIEEIVRDLGVERVLFASGEPRNRASVVLDMIARLDLDDAQRAAVLGGNARRLLKLP